MITKKLVDNGRDKVLVILPTLIEDSFPEEVWQNLRLQWNFAFINPADITPSEKELLLTSNNVLAEQIFSLGYQMWDACIFGLSDQESYKGIHNLIVERKFQEINVNIGKYKLKYLFSPGKTNRLVFSFPQGLRTARFFTDRYRFFSNDWNIIVPDFADFRERNSNENVNLHDLAALAEGMINHAKFRVENTVLLGKSFSSLYVEQMVLNSEKYLGTIIVAGPRFWNKRQAKLNVFLIDMILKSKLLRIITDKFMEFKDKTSLVKLSYVDWSKYEIWSEIRSLYEQRIRPMSSHSGKSLIIFNGSDGLVSEANKQEIKSSFKNADFVNLPTYSHWSAPTMEEHLSIKNYLDRVIKDK